ncbi:MAG: hypothetical protein Q8O13_10665 [Candidatus Omnitrophota bacterium]|nr:hypothetical protein [Candidatus Omnitrophota bacterium]
MKEKYPRAWEEVSKEEAISLHTYRLRVYGGWLVRTFGRSESSNVISQAVCFVPDEAGHWKLEEEKGS